MEVNENEYKTYQNSWNAAKSELRRTFIAFNPCIRKEKNYPDKTNI